jgi:hypothetical protein
MVGMVSPAWRAAAPRRGLASRANRCRAAASSLSRWRSVIIAVARCKLIIMATLLLGVITTIHV